MAENNYDSALRALAVAAKSAGYNLLGYSVTTRGVLLPKHCSALEGYAAAYHKLYGRIPGSLRTKRLRKKRNVALNRAAFGL